jgi:5-methylcytosine-specific restriction endonuclease McrA
MPPTFRSARQRSTTERKAEADGRRGSARVRGYTTPWDKAAAGHRAKHPLCVYCAMGAWGDAPRDTAADLIDHLIPHRGDQAIFWNRRDWVSSCTDCHNGPKQRTERNPRALAVLANAVRAFMRTPGG